MAQATGLLPATAGAGLVAGGCYRWRMTLALGALGKITLAPDPVEDFFLSQAIAVLPQNHGGHWRTSLMLNRQ